MAIAHPAQARATSERLLTLGEWAALPKDTAGELVDGVLMEEEVSDSIHELVVTWLVALFRTWLRGRGGFVFGSDLKLAVSDLRGRKPDLSVYLPGGVAPPRRGLVRLPPDIAVEVVSPSSRDERRDRIEKMGEYSAFGIRYYWLVDPAPARPARGHRLRRRVQLRLSPVLSHSTVADLRHHAC